MGIVETIETATGGHVADWAQRRVHITMTPTRDALTNLRGQIMHDTSRVKQNAACSSDVAPKRVKLGI